MLQAGLSVISDSGVMLAGDTDGVAATVLGEAVFVLDFFAVDFALFLRGIHGLSVRKLLEFNVRIF